MLNMDNPIHELIVLALIFLGIFILFIVISRIIVVRLKKIVKKTDSLIDDYIVKLFTSPVLLILFSILLMSFAPSFISRLPKLAFLKTLSSILLTLSIGWLLVLVTRALSKYFQNKYNLKEEDNMHARSKVTKIRMFENIAIFLLVAIFIALALMNIEGARTIGKSILASAGVIGILVGLAAQKSMGQILSGIQIALTQPVKINDFVNINGELGQIEEITLTYIVVKIWDDRRLVVPIDYFLNNPVENWTNKTSEIVGKIYFYVAYSLPLEPIRKKLSSILEGDPNWDGRVQRVQVTDCRELVKEVRISVSSSNISDNFALRLKVREEIIDFINSEYPNALGILQFESNKSISN